MSGDTSSALSINDLTFSYGEAPLLRIDQFDVSARDRVAVLGPSGCGKTTFVHLIAGLLRPGQLTPKAINVPKDTSDHARTLRAPRREVSKSNLRRNGRRLIGPRSGTQNSTRFGYCTKSPKNP